MATYPVNATMNADGVEFMSSGAAVEVCVVFTARERYAHAPQALEALFANTKVPFRLLIVDAATPKRYLRRMEAVVRGRPRVEFIVHDGYLLPNQARNLGIASVREPFVFFVENDCEIRPGTLERLLEVSRNSAAVAVPWMMEDGRRHFDMRMGRVVELDNGEIAINPASDWRTPPPTLEKIEFFENHSFLMPLRSLRAAGPLDEELNTRELIDLSLSVRRAGVPAFLVPGAVVDFFAPPPIHWDELTHYRRRWDLEHVEASNKRVQMRWRISNMPRTTDFAWRQHLRVSRWTWGALWLWLALERIGMLLRRKVLDAVGHS